MALERRHEGEVFRAAAAQAKHRDIIKACECG
jgi:hypothetical protein